MNLPIAPNWLREAPPLARRDAVRVADITYVDTARRLALRDRPAGPLHAPVCGLGDGRHPGHESALAALDMALTYRKPSGGLGHHSDRGVQYASDAYRQRLVAEGVVPSMSRRATVTTTP